MNANKAPKAAVKENENPQKTTTRSSKFQVKRSPKKILTRQASNDFKTTNNRNVPKFKLNERKLAKLVTETTANKEDVKHASTNAVVEDKPSLIPKRVTNQALTSKMSSLKYSGKLQKRLALRKYTSKAKTLQKPNLNLASNRTTSPRALTRNMASSSDLETNSSEQHLRTSQCLNIAVQTDEAEILNNSLLVGDVKFIQPSEIAKQNASTNFVVKDKQSLIPKRVINQGLTSKLSTLKYSGKLRNDTFKTKTLQKEKSNLASTKTTIPRMLTRNMASFTARAKKLNYDLKSNSSEKSLTKSRALNIAIQTNEAEILNHSLLEGDVKFLQPSQFLLDEIEKQHKDMKTKQILQVKRKFEKHSEREEQYLNDLNEFLEKSFVTKKQCRKSRESIEEESKLFISMDQLWNSQMTKCESITDIRARIKHKEQELLNLFDNW